MIQTNYLDCKRRIKPLENSDAKQDITLVHKEDLFNYEYAPQVIETELLNGQDS